MKSFKHEGEGKGRREKVVNKRIPSEAEELLSSPYLLLPSSQNNPIVASKTKREVHKLSRCDGTDARNRIKEEKQKEKITGQRGRRATEGQNGRERDATPSGWW